MACITEVVSVLCSDPQIASAEAGGVRLALELLQPPATVRTAALELLQELLGGLLNPPVYQAFAMVRQIC